MILYPALATPEIVVGDSDKLEVLLLTQSDYPIPWLRMRIRDQLKFGLGLEPLKMVSNEALFTNAEGIDVFSTEDRKIEIKKLDFKDGQLIQTESGRFSGYVDKRAYKMYKDAGYGTLYSVSMSSKVLTAQASSGQLSACGEPQDQIINGVLARRSAWAKQGPGYYCFQDGAGDLDFTKFDLNDPIQSYHPVYVYRPEDLPYANLAHIADIHVATRQEVMALTRARVIDYPGGSPPIGDLVNICSKVMIEIMGKLGSSGADFLLIGGDLIDFMRDCYLSANIAATAGSGVPARVWEAVALDDNYTDRYKDAPGLIAFFSLLIRFCRSNPMPAFAITGNHDCYFEPFGISPRITIDAFGLEIYEKRPNQGIPADHNLTFYEAILAFGETYGKIVPGLKSPFTKEWFDWFYAVFTPFCDFSVELPKQYLVACAWGDNETMIDALPKGQGFGHLPRSDDGVSDEQLNLITMATAKGKKVILMTHYTFVSYLETVPVNQGDTTLGDVYFSFLKGYDEYNMGTFEENRRTMFELHCGQNRDLQVILTGHSHRRALYLVDRIDYSGRDSVKTRHFDLLDFAQAKSKHSAIFEPAIIVSDSGGTIPRYNLAGEFDGWGSDPASGTSVFFNPDTGVLDGVGVAAADTTCRPRVAVSLDYLDIYEGKDVVVRFQSLRFPIDDEKNNKLTELIFDIHLAPDLVKRGLSINELAFFLKWNPEDDWRKITLTSRGNDMWAIDGVCDVHLFCGWFARSRTRGVFLSMNFNPIPGLPRYNYVDPWCWEFQVDDETFGRGLFQWSPTHKLYKIERDKNRAEKPDFDWRRHNFPEKYT